MSGRDPSGGGPDGGSGGGAGASGGGSDGASGGGSNKSGVAEQVLSLPSGGGALEGTGGSFTTRKQTGAGSFSLPIEVPDGRKGLQPDLSLSYSTGNGDGAFGMGWVLDPGSVSRKTTDGVPVYDEVEDTFLLDGGEDLVPVEQYDDGGTSVTRYRPRTESDFARIEHRRSGTTDHWRVEATDGTVRRYGTPDRRGDDPGVVADPDDRSRVYRWELTETVDPFGNRVVYDYARDRGDTPAHRWDQLYLDRVRYVDYEDESGETAFLVAVDFEYDDRPEPVSRYRAGFEVRTGKRCSRIVVRTRADADRAIRSYELRYRDEVAGDGGADNGASQLASVQVVGHDDGATQRQPPLEFEYSGFDPTGRDFRSLDGPVPRRSLAAPELELADLSGDGLPDVVEIDGTIRYWRNLGGGEFDDPRPMDRSPAGLSLADPGVQLMDADGDGRVDLVHVGGPPTGYFPLDRDGGWAEESFQPYDRVPNVDFGAPNVELVDLDGDAATDLLRTGDSLQCFFQDPEEGWHDTRTAAGSLDGLAQLDFADPRLRLADLTGDGLQDVVLVDDGNVTYWPNLGHGDWGRRVRTRDPPDLPGDHDPGRVLLGDVDGDGAADVVHVEDDRVTLWLNRCGNGWSDPLVVEGTPSVVDTDAIRLVDVEGDGVGGLLYSGGGRPGSDEMYFLDFVGDVKPYLMTETRNNAGAVTRVEYAPSTAFYLRDERDGRPWKTTLPTPTWVVARVESVDEISGGRLTEEYAYRHGHWDGGEREFRGFGAVEQRDSESFEDYSAGSRHGGRGAAAVEDRERFSPPTLTRTWFHVGPVGPEHGDWRELDYRDEFWEGDPPVVERPAATRELLDRLPRRERRDAVRSLRGRRLRTEVYALDGTDREDRPYEVSEQRFGVRAESPPAADRPGRRPVFFPHPARSRETSWERGADPRTRLTVTGDFDRYGQPQQTVEVAPPRGWRPGERTDGYLATLTRTSYASRDDGSRFVVDRTAESAEFEVRADRDLTVEEFVAAVERGTADHELVGLTRHYYDGPAFEGLALGEIGDHGARVRTEELVLTDETVAEAYPGGTEPPDGAGPPAFLTEAAPAWDDAYPAAFRDGVAERAGYVVAEDLPAEATASVGYFAQTRRVALDVQPGTGGVDTDRGLLVARRDELGNETTLLGYDPYALNPTRVSNPHGLVTTAEYDYAAMQPRQVTDPNGNRTRNTYTPLGLVASVARLGTAGGEEGDTPDQPGKRFVYDLRAFERSPADDRQPKYVHTVERRRHRWDVVERENERRRESGDPPLSDAEVAALFPLDPSADVPERPELEQYPERFVQSREYSDGFGRVVQTRSRAPDRVFGDDPTFGDGTVSGDRTGDDAAPVAVDGVGDGATRVRVNGWKTHDNKGNVVEQYEPFLSGAGWAYLSRREAAGSRPETFRRRTETFYDALSRETRAVNPDGSESRTVRGRVPPDDLDDPDAFEPTPWERFDYDENDNAGRTHGADAADYDHHWNTPTSERFDARDRAVETVERNRTAGEERVEVHRVRREFDARGNVAAVTDPLGRVAVESVYDLADRTLRTESVDAGTERVVRDAAGNVLERRDGKGALRLQRHDASGRTTHGWARDGDGAAVTLRRRVIHAVADDALSRSDARARNLLGEVHRAYDGAGRVRFDGYDFRGNALRKERRVLADDAVRGGPVDWAPPTGGDPADREGALLADGRFRVATAYDAMDRVTRTRYPEDAEGDRKELRRGYDAGGNLARLTLVTRPGAADERTETFVADAGYNAAGDRTFVAYGNGVMTRYAYDDRTGRLERQLTQPFGTTGAGGYAPDGSATLQDFGYEYDLGGNVRTVGDWTPNCGVKDAGRGADRLDRRFEYDALDRLTAATGREAATMPAPRPWTDTKPTADGESRYGVPDVNRTNAPQHAALYTERYEYDAVGNLAAMRHRGAADWTRTFGVGGAAPGDWTGDGWATTPASNRATHVRDRGGLSRPTHEYDAAGNLLRERNSRFAWDHADRLRSYEETATNGSTSVAASYAYDAAGERVKKVVDKGGVTEVTVYVEGVFEYRRRETDGGDASSNSTLHVGGEDLQVALVRVGDPLADGDPTPPVRYHHGDHLDSTTLVVDGDGDWVDHEEFTPFGETAFGSYAHKRYRFTGKERDEESGLYYHGARYYAPWLARWTATDPAGNADGLNRYAYARNNPVRRTDPSGRNGETAQKISRPGESGAATAGRAAGNATASTAGETAARSAGASAGNAATGTAGETAARSAGAAAGGGAAGTAGETAAAAAGRSAGSSVAASASGSAAGTSATGTAGETAAGAAGEATAKQVTKTAKGVARRSFWDMIGDAISAVWNDVLAPLVRTATNALAGFALGTLIAGPVGGIIGGGIGALTGHIHGGALAEGDSYDWGSPSGWLQFLADNTWSLPNSFAASLFLMGNLVAGNEISPKSENTGSVVLKNGVFSGYATTVGNVVAGTNPLDHELVHAMQARIFGPLYLPLVAANFVVGTVAPYWLLYHDFAAEPIDSIGDYFEKGVYPHTWHEEWAYGTT